MRLWSGLFGLDGDLRPSLAAPEVEEGGGEGESDQVSEPPLWSPLVGCSPLTSLELHTALLCRFYPSNCLSTSTFSHPAAHHLTCYFCFPISCH